MMPQINLAREGLFDPRTLERWQRTRKTQMNAAAARAMSAFGAETDIKLREDAARNFKVNRRNFLTSFKHKVYFRNRERLPAMTLGTSLPFGKIFEKGGVVRSPGGLLIPINTGGRRIGYVKFKQIITNLLRTGNAFFKKVNGKVILFAENITENSGDLARWKRAVRRGMGGGRIKRGAELPIAVLVPQVMIRKRLHVEQIVRRGLPRLAQMIEREVGVNAQRGGDGPG